MAYPNYEPKPRPNRGQNRVTAEIALRDCVIAVNEGRATEIQLSISKRRAVDYGVPANIIDNILKNIKDGNSDR